MKNFRLKFLAILGAALIALSGCEQNAPVKDTDAPLSSISESSEVSSQTDETSSEISESSAETSSETSAETSSESSSVSESSESSSSLSSAAESSLPESTSSALESQSSSQSSSVPIVHIGGKEEVSGEYTVSLSSYEVQQGSYLAVKIEGLDLSGEYFSDFLGHKRPFMSCEGGCFAFIPVSPSVKAGSYTFSLQKNGLAFSKTVTVTERTFPTQYLTVSESTLDQTLESEAASIAFDNFFQEHRHTYTEKALWSGSFVDPLGSYPYRQTTKFGSFRTFSNGDTEWHNAVDMAAAGGTPIYATNSGKIIFANWLDMTGYTVVIDHGYGVLSWHYHLSAMDVSKGDYVEKNQVIGKVGTTGLSTGNHLHFAISIGGYFTDPYKIIGTEPNLYFDLKVWLLGCTFLNEIFHLR